MDNATFRRFCATNGVALLDYSGSTVVGVNDPRTNAAINPSAVYDTWAEVQALPKTAANDGLIVICKEVGVGGSTWRYSHANLRWYPYGRCILSANQTTVTHTGSPKTTYEAMSNTQLINDHATTQLNVWQDLDILCVSYFIKKPEAVDAFRTDLLLHTATGTGGTSARGASHTAGPAYGLRESLYIQRISATSVRFLNTHNAVAGESVVITAGAIQADVTVTDMDTSECWLNSVFKLNATNDTAPSCIMHRVELIATGA